MCRTTHPSLFEPKTVFSSLKRSVRMNNNMTCIIELPNEILWSIIEQLSGKTIAICAQVCKRFSEVANNDALWKNICHKKKWDSVATSVSAALDQSAKTKSEKLKKHKKPNKKSNKEEPVINWKKVYKYIDMDQKLKLRLLYNDYFFVNQTELHWRIEFYINGEQFGPVPDEATVRGLVRYLTDLIRIERERLLILCQPDLLEFGDSHGRQYNYHLCCQDPFFLHVFFVSYRTFTKPTEVFERLWGRYTTIAQDPKESNDQFEQRKRTIMDHVVDVFVQWIVNYDFVAVGLSKSVDFQNFYSHASADHKERIKRALIDYEQKTIEKVFVYDDSFKLAMKIPAPIVPKDYDKHFLPKLTDLGSLELARQMTMFDFKTYRQINREEFTTNCWKTQLTVKVDRHVKQEEGAISILLRRQSNMTYWVLREILSITDLQARVDRITYFVHLMKHLLQMNNFHSANSIYRGLTHSWSAKLSKTWSKFRSSSQSEEKFLERCRRLFDSSSNYLDYRNLLAECKNPVLPLIVATLAEIDRLDLFLFKGDNIVNFSGRVWYWETISRFMKYQLVPYGFETLDKIQIELNRFAEAAISNSEIVELFDKLTIL